MKKKTISRIPCQSLKIKVLPANRSYMEKKQAEMRPTSANKKQQEQKKCEDLEKGNRSAIFTIHS